MRHGDGFRRMLVLGGQARPRTQAPAHPALVGQEDRRQEWMLSLPLDQEAEGVENFAERFALRDQLQRVCLLGKHPV